MTLIPDSLIEAVCEEAWGIDLRQESGETRRLFARDAARIITVVQESEDVVLAKAAIERLTKALANSEADYFRLRDKAAQFRDEWQSLEGVVQRVREVCDGIEPDHSVFVGDVLDALNGGRR